MVARNLYEAEFEEILLNPQGIRFDSPKDVIWDPHLDHDQKIETLENWLARERILYKSDRDSSHIAQMRQIEHSIRTLMAMRRAEGAYY
jgi:hypothetical protein